MTIKLSWNYIWIITLVLISCHGDIGRPGLNSLINVVPENPGLNCAYGGIKVEYGLDNDNNKILSSDEIQNQSFICNGKNGVDGASYLFEVMVEGSGTNCQFGGYKLISGLDSNRNGILDLSEHQNSFYLCSTKNYLLSTVYENPGQNCPSGGYKLIGGIDANGNGQLDSNEITSNQYICNGSNAVTDKITRIEIPAASANTTSTQTIITGKLINFNKADYATDSIVLVTDPYTGGGGNLVLVELYNITDGLPIVGSSVSATSAFGNRSFLFSANVVKNLPNKQITIGVSTKNSIDGQFAANTSTGLYLFIYKK